MVVGGMLFAALLLFAALFALPNLVQSQSAPKLVSNT